MLDIYSVMLHCYVFITALVENTCMQVFVPLITFPVVFVDSKQGVSC